MFSDPQFWVAVAFVAFIAAIFNPVRKILTGSLDTQIKDIRNKIDEAENLKNETQTTLSEIKKRQNDVQIEIQDTIENQLKQARTDASEMIKSSSLSLQDKAQIELTKLDKELDAKIEQSSATIEKSKNESVVQIQNQINEITKLTLSKVAAFDVSDDEIKNAIKSTERSIN